MSTIEARLNGFFIPQFKTDHRVLMRLSEMAAVTSQKPYTVEICNARLIQPLADSEANFFGQRSFVLLPHISAVQNWDSEPALDPAASQSDVTRFYLPEIDSIIRNRLLPGQRVEIQQPPSVTRRGAGTNSNVYGNGVHSDLGLTPDDYQENLAAWSTDAWAQKWRDRFECDDVTGFMTIDFWRTTNMAGPLQHMPLALCDPNSVAMADVVPSGLLDFTPTRKPTNQISLRHNPGQRWYWYPDMTGDELLAFKLFEYRKRESPAVLRNCFHSAFVDPHAPKDAELRQSCEHRVGVFLLDGVLDQNRSTSSGVSD